MKEGWNSDDYVILFEKAESKQMTDAYGIRQYLPGLAVVAIVGWDDFIVRNETGQLFRVPAVPLVQKYLEEYDRALDADTLVSDERLTGKIKWYTKPIVFGGDPNSQDNMTWVDLDTHQKLVRWWNRKYVEIKQRTGAEPGAPADADKRRR